MTPTSIILLLLGIAFLVFSFFLVDHSKETENENNKEGQSKNLKLSEEEIEEVKSQIHTLLEAESYNQVIDADDQMSKIANEKIMAVNDFATQVLEKIDVNHKEVVFLYDMLNQKEEEIKVTFSRMETIRRENKEFLEKLSVMMAGRVKAKGQAEKVATPLNSLQQKSGTLEEEELENKDTLHQARELENQMTLQEDFDIAINEEYQNKNEEILKLHQQNKSILEISKQLELGQGEVKLIIDLYSNK